MRSVFLTSNATNLVNNAINELLSDGIVTTGIYHELAPSFSQSEYVDLQLFAASSLPLINSSGWKSER